MEKQEENKETLDDIRQRINQIEKELGGVSAPPFTTAPNKKKILVTSKIIFTSIGKSLVLATVVYYIVTLTIKFSSNSEKTNEFTSTQIDTAAIIKSYEKAIKNKNGNPAAKRSIDSLMATLKFEVAGKNGNGIPGFGPKARQIWGTIDSLIKTNVE